MKPPTGCAHQPRADARHCAHRWCPGRDSNPHDLHRGILSPLRLPFRHPGRRIACLSGTGLETARVNTTLRTCSKCPFSACTQASLCYLSIIQQHSRCSDSDVPILKVGIATKCTHYGLLSIRLSRFTLYNHVFIV